MELINPNSLLSPKENLVIGLRCQGKTLAEIGLIIGKTRERVRQVEAKGEEKIKYHIRVGNIKLN